ncbi:helix-turn-helix transcriptional regulator [Thauera sp.]
MAESTAKLRFIRRREVARLTGFSEGRICELERQGNFPRSVRLSAHSLAYIEAEVLRWMQDRIDERDFAHVVEALA